VGPGGAAVVGGADVADGAEVAVAPVVGADGPVVEPREVSGPVPVVGAGCEEAAVEPVTPAVVLAGLAPSDPPPQAAMTKTPTTAATTLAPTLPEYRNQGWTLPGAGHERSVVGDQDRGNERLVDH
jgi:hypothetical protein